MSLSTAPSIYDFQGKLMTFPEGGDPTITSNGVTWRDEINELSEDQILNISSAGVVLDAVRINGGHQGVHVKEGWTLTITACEVSRAQYGIVLSGNGFLLACDLGVTDCTESNVWIGDKSTAKLTRGSITSDGINIGMQDNNYMIGEDLNVYGSCSDAMLLRNNAKLFLEICILSGNPGSVEDRASVVCSKCNFCCLGWWWGVGPGSVRRLWYCCHQLVLPSYATRWSQHYLFQTTSVGCNWCM